MSNTLQKIQELFDYESIKYESATASIRSKRIPFPLFSFDLRQYSRLNWVGINPFIFITSIEVIVESQNYKKSNLRIEINQTRTILIYLFVISLLLMVAINLPSSVLAMIFFIILSILSGLFIFSLNINRLIRKEIINAIKA